MDKIKGDNDLTEIIKRAQRALEDLKKAQLSGASDIQIIESSTSNVYDKTTGSIPSLSPAIVNAQFFASKQAYAFAQVGYKVFVDGTSPGDEIHPGHVLYPNIKEFHIIPTVGFPEVNNFNLTFYNTDVSSHTYYFKFFIRSTDAGTIS